MPVEAFWEELEPVLDVAPAWDHRRNAPTTGGGAVGGSVIALVGGDAARRLRNVSQHQRSASAALSG